MQGGEAAQGLSFDAFVRSGLVAGWNRIVALDENEMVTLFNQVDEALVDRADSMLKKKAWWREPSLLRDEAAGFALADRSGTLHPDLIRALLAAAALMRWNDEDLDPLPVAAGSEGFT